MEHVYYLRTVLPVSFWENRVWKLKKLKERNFIIISHPSKPTSYCSLACDGAVKIGNIFMHVCLFFFRGQKRKLKRCFDQSATLWNQQRCYRLPTMTMCRSKMKSSVWRCEKLPHISFLLKHSHKDKNIGAFYFKLCEFLQFFLHLLKKYTSDPGKCTHLFKQTVQPSSFFILKDLIDVHKCLRAKNWGHQRIFFHIL